MQKKSKIYHFPVGNGDMSLIEIASNNQYFRILCDMHIRNSSNRKTDGFDETQCDVIARLHEILEKDGDSRPYIDVLILTHPDEDHIRGFAEYFHTGAVDEYNFSNKDEEYDKIFVREIWSSPIIFKRKKNTHTLCTDAIAFNKEAKRRVKLYRDNGCVGIEGNRIRLIGEDQENKTDDILNIVYKRGDTIKYINETYVQELNVVVLAPLDDADFPDDIDVDKNRSSIVMRWAIASHGRLDPTNHLLLGGDAEVHCWEIINEKHQSNTEILQYDILIAPHHVSWRVLSKDSYSKCEDPQVSDKAIAALGYAKENAVIIASSNKINNDKNDPPNYQAMKEYMSILSDVDGEFKSLAIHKPNKMKYPEVLEYRLTAEGPQEEDGSVKADATKTAMGMAKVTAVQIPHGSTD